MIKFDPFNEDANCIFMKIFAAQRDEKALIKYYEGYVKMIKKELGIYPESTIIDLYEELIKSCNS